MKWTNFCCAVAIVAILPTGVFSQAVQLVNAFPALTFTYPVLVTHAGDGTNRIFVLQQNGLIKVFPNDSAVTSASVFLNIANKLISTGGGGDEQGLLGLAFHPNYANNGYFYVNYVAPGPRRTVIARYSVMPGNPNKADSLSELKILEIDQPFSNHNGGMVFFGTDGFLYIAMGDGGSGGDPGDRAQNLQNLLGKILRIDVDTTNGPILYGIPRENPLVGNLNNYREEIYAWGMRNPFRASQDAVTGHIYAGDVGQDNWEEVDVIESGKNYGWRCYEGTHTYNTSGCTGTYTAPVKEYSSGSGSSECTVIGGYVYRGYRRPEMTGSYVYGDYCSGKIWRFRYNGSVASPETLIVDTPFQVTGFGMDRDGELYICNYTSGNIQRFAGPGLTGLSDPLVTLPKSFSLAQNYPNPFNPSTTIRYTLPQSEHVTLKVLDVLGGEVATLIDGVQAAGNRSVEFNASRLSSGIYLYRLTAGSFSESRKMLVIK